MAVPRWAQGVMVYGLLADLIVIVHLGFIAFIVVRGILGVALAPSPRSASSVG